jgi:N-acylglucosamine 2-epimerase
LAHASARASRLDRLDRRWQEKSMNQARASDDLAALRDFLRGHLFDNVMPFWLNHAVDPAGGLSTCIRDDGTIVSRDKWLWSQWRAVWVFSKLYNDFGHDPKWLELASHVYSFAARHGWDAAAGGWRLRVSGDGEILDGCDSIYVDGFAIYGLAEYFRATGSGEAARLARRTADVVIERLAAPHDSIPHFPYPVPLGARVHGIPMMFSLVLWELGQALDEDRYRDAAVTMTDEIFGRFYRPDRDLIVERVSVDGSEMPPPAGTAVVPGHVIEDMWFQVHIAGDRGDRPRIEEACRLMRRHLEFGWDGEWGGILLAVDADGRSEVGWKFADTKLWWPHTEALYALLLAHEQVGEDWCLDWYDKVHSYSFERYPDRQHGEWVQKLDRRGEPITDVVALPVKDPFHLPRALIYCVQVLDRLVGKP